MYCVCVYVYYKQSSWTDSSKDFNWLVADVFSWFNTSYFILRIQVRMNLEIRSVPTF